MFLKKNTDSESHPNKKGAQWAFLQAKTFVIPTQMKEEIKLEFASDESFCVSLPIPASSLQK